MMDSHLIIIIACVFLASLFSLLFINKFFRRKTFEEVIAEKKALTEKIYGKDRVATKKPRKQGTKKESKREKKQKHREQQQQQVDIVVTESHLEDLAVLSEPQKQQQQRPQLLTYDESPMAATATSIKEIIDSELLTHKNESCSGILTNANRRSSNIDKENMPKVTKSNKKEKKLPTTQKSIVVSNNKHDKKDTAQIVNVAIKDDKHILETSPISVNNVQASKTMVESKKEEKNVPINQGAGKREKNGKKNLSNENREKYHNDEDNNGLGKEDVLVGANAVKDVIKNVDERPRPFSPKTNTQAINKANKQYNKKHKENKDAVVSSLDQLTDRDTVSVSLLMNLFRRAELNRSEIQILIDYLLNRQQDMPTNHAEWSDDVCQKLKRQLKDAERALAEEQEASIGIQAKLRELRAEINSERTTMNVTIKSYMEKLQAKDQDIVLLEQKIKTLNDTLAVERQQFQAKLIHEKQSATQDLLAQIQIMQNDLTHKDKCVAELTCIVNASRQAVEESQQKNEIIQQQAQQLRVLEQQRDELEQVSNNRIFELEKAKQVETELNETKIELRNLQNALESAKSDANQSRLAAEAIRNDAALAHTHLKNIANKAQEQSKEQSDLQAAYEAIKQKLADKDNHLTNAKLVETQLQQKLMTMEAASKEQAEQQLSLQKTIDLLGNQIDDYKKQLVKHDELMKQQQTLEKLTDTLQAELKEKETKLSDYHQFLDQIQELQKLISILKDDVADKECQLQQAKQQAEVASKQEQLLIEQLKEQKLKNNELRMKNWKLVEALQNAETKAIKINEKEQQKLLATAPTMMQIAGDGGHSGNSIGGSGSGSNNVLEERRVRELFQRLYPDAVKACASTALAVSFDQWMEQVLASHSKQQLLQLQQQQQQQQQQQNLQINSNHKSTQSSDNSYTLSLKSATQNSHNGKDSRSESPSVMTANKTMEATATSNSEMQKTTDAALFGGGSGDSVADHEALLQENKLLRLRIEELTQLARKTDNIVSDLKHRAKEQDDHWRSVLQTKNDEISALRHPNGQQEDI